ncbi:MAG: hypothetical protein A2V81_03325 [Candidatus Abawacabacteria bacterium RBG_16_42_10]|uniref:Polysaccharide biosynthesis protein C-terminal domain-containing protein n=1 Tax=Candidatus Abawacabacteria bacterium RBG_16_42_10 TaxID=1817814 RepID=A0A1F4XJG0_9BACT|nr:MAG: hypothetical protein A2V81_03325 [Candidatus Abawacabacteria bacterium RBG_16_42_10]
MSIPNLSLAVLGKKIAFSTVVQYGGKLLQLVIGAIILKLISQYLSQSEYGVYGTIMEYALFFSMLANLGIFANVVRRMADAPRDGKIFLNALVLRIMTAISIFLTAILILLLGQGNDVFVFGSLLFLGALLFDYVTSVCDGMLQANYLMGRTTAALLLGRGLYLLLIWWSVQMATFSIPFAFLFNVIAALVTAAVSFYFVARKIDWSWKIDTKLMWSILITGLPFGIISIINSLYFRFLPDYFAHGALSDAEFGTFNISFRIAQVLALFSTFLMFSVLPGLKQFIDEKHWHKVKSLYKVVWKILLTVGALLVVFGGLFGEMVITLLTDKKYFLPEFWFLLPMMLLVAAISYGYDLILITLFALEHDMWLLKREFIALTIAGIVFACSWLVDDIPTKLLLIIAASLVGETTMVILGTRKIKEVLSSKF